MLAFDRFRKDLQTEAYWPETIAQTNDKFDGFITGSDQVFNLKLTGGDPAYYLNFVAEDKVRAAYAVGMGDYLDKYDKIYKENVRSLICSPSGKRQANKLHNCKAAHCKMGGFCSFRDQCNTADR